jgi:outer membrane receptor for ferrienterochelin and colicins
MKKILTLLGIILLNLPLLAIEDEEGGKTDAIIVGHVVSKGEHIAFVTISIVGTTMGTTTDETGHYQLVDVPEGTHIVRAQSMGYKPREEKITIQAGETKEIKFELVEDILGLEEVVITSDRNESNRIESSIIVNTITPKIFDRTQSITLSEGLNFVPGLRMENNCQNCGFSQVRMNGMEGPYSQILINSRQIFSGLAGVYGLELIPANMIERVEVVRGGGSALYGSNAIAGTINLILKDPIKNTYEFGYNYGLIGVGLDDAGDPANDHSFNVNTSLVSADHKTGMAIYGFYRNRDPFDANNDAFSEISLLKNTTVGGRVFHRLGNRNKLSADFFNIRESRRGGNRFEEPNHMADISEAIEHNITTGALTFEQFVGKMDLLTLFVSGQNIDRDTYYGAEQSLSDYGTTDNFTINTGAQYNALFNDSRSKLISGIEYRGETLKDVKEGYPYLDTISGETAYADRTVIANQTKNIIGLFAEYEIRFGKFDFSVGGRFDHYEIKDTEHEGTDKIGDVFSPRVTVKYDVKEVLQLRASYAQGYRAPQIFDEDLHIETSGSRKVSHRNDPDLKQETSQTFMVSGDYNKLLGSVYFGFLLEGFYTILNDAFVNEIGEPDEDGTVIYTRTNAEGGAVVQGVNIEMNIIPSKKFSFKGGFTIQSSEYEEAQEFDETRFFRTPNDYGYFTLDWTPIKQLGISANGNYTGKMLIPYFGPTIPEPETGELRESDPFFDVGIKVRYTIKLNGASLQLFTGMKNIFNSYQDDFDSGIDRDPGYIYGPLAPRTFFVGLKLGNMLN